MPVPLEDFPRNHVALAFEEGDGVVLRASSLLDERQDGDFTLSVRSPLRFDSTLLLPEEHVDITKSAVFGDNLLFWLLQSQRGGEALVDPSKVPLKAEPFEGDTSSQRPDT